MKKILFLLILFFNIQLACFQDEWSVKAGFKAEAQHMYKEAGDNCQKGNKWYMVSELCDGAEESTHTCQYCGLYFSLERDRKSHQRKCKFRPHIEYEYDKSGNRIERRTINYRQGYKVVADNEPITHRDDLEFFFNFTFIAILQKKESFEDDCSYCRFI